MKYDYEWYVEHQFSETVKRQHKKDWKDRIKFADVQLACALAAIKLEVR